MPKVVVDLRPITPYAMKLQFACALVAVAASIVNAESFVSPWAQAQFNEVPAGARYNPNPNLIATIHVRL